MKQSKKNTFSFRTDPKSDDNSSDTDSDQYATIKRCPKDTKKSLIPKTSGNVSNKENVKSQEENIIKEPEKVINNEKFPEKTQIPDQQYIDEYIYTVNNEGYKARALYDYQAGKRELKNEEIYIFNLSRQLQLFVIYIFS